MERMEWMVEKCTEFGIHSIHFFNSRYSERKEIKLQRLEKTAIAALKQKALSLKHSAKKSEILRAGIKLLSSLNDKAFLAALSNVPALKTGRPAKD